jgi:hypothetical protein
MNEQKGPAAHNDAVIRADGATPSERYLAKLCQHSFLSLWSHSGVFRDQGRRNGKGDGKEVCDLLVVFENHIIIFSDKECRFGNSADLKVDWARWYRKAILKSAEQLWGAERWIKQFPNSLYIDRACQAKFPVPLPDRANAIFHRILVAHDGARRCRECLGGSGSLMLNNRVVGDAHLVRPFTIGQIDVARGFVHIFDDTSIDILMKTLDTVSDFTSYLMKKEKFLSSQRTIHAAGEEELLALYLQGLNDSQEHDFIVDGQFDAIAIDEGFWDRHQNSVERLAQIQSDKISYAWDAIIERFTSHAMSGTQYFTSGRPLREQERMFRFLAREPRTRRRALAKDLLQVIERSTTSASAWDARIVMPSHPDEPLYIFLAAKRKPTSSDSEYREFRRRLLSAYCEVAKLKHPSAKHIIGFATEDGSAYRRSEDLWYLDASDWDAASEKRAREIQEELGILKTVKTSVTREHEYPADATGKPRRTVPPKNSLCPCGSGKKFKRCHGTGRPEKSRRQK